MTPAINILKKKKIPFTTHQYEHDPSAESYGLEAAEKLEVDPDRVFKTLVVQLDSSELAVAIIPVARMLNMKLFAKAVGSKKAAMADQTAVERTTGYVLGGVSPLGQKKQLRTIIDGTARDFGTIFVSGGKRGLDIELAPADLLQLLRAEFAGISQ